MFHTMQSLNEGKCLALSLYERTDTAVHFVTA